MALMKKKRKSFSLYQKFAGTMILFGLVPMLVLTTLITNNMIRDYREALKMQYEQAAGYVSTSLVSNLDSYNNISKMPYYYNISAYGTTYMSYMSFDNFRKIIYGEIYSEDSMESERKADMENFLDYLGSMDGFIDCTHFIAEDLDGNKLDFHYGTNGTYFKDEALFEEYIDYEHMDRENKKLMLIAPHNNDYINGIHELQITLARNYFDLRGSVGNTPYVGTLFLDVNLKKIRALFSDVKFQGNEIFYVVNEEGECFYSNEKDKAGKNISKELQKLQNTEQQLVIATDTNDYGLSVVVVMDTEEAFGAIRQTQRMIYFMIAGAAFALMLGSLFFSRRLT